MHKAGVQFQTWLKTEHSMDLIFEDLESKDVTQSLKRTFLFNSKNGKTGKVQ